MSSLRKINRVVERRNQKERERLAAIEWEQRRKEYNDKKAKEREEMEKKGEAPVRRPPLVSAIAMAAMLGMSMK
ncbi:MAG: hypothetical protein EKK57_07205 [Proteobacteria bacterium]|nr:MAG: hypothetical protein EKK57_07205 [Pseudomonadota bacterium]